MNFDGHSNFAVSTVATAPTPNTVGTTLILASGDGTIFPTPPFNAVVTPAGANALASNSEIIRVTGKAGDVLTIVRAQEGTTAKAITAGDVISSAITAKLFTDIEDVVNNLISTVTTTSAYDLTNGVTGSGHVVLDETPTINALALTGAVTHGGNAFLSSTGVIGGANGNVRFKAGKGLQWWNATTNLWHTMLTVGNPPQLAFDSGEA